MQLQAVETRYQAFGIHFAISLLIFIILASIIVLFWYPGFLFHTDGGWQGIRIIAGVDLILGPVLTLMVYKKGKPGLKFDLSAIAATQLVCLMIGIFIVYGQRPLAVVFADGKFHSPAKEQYVLDGVKYKQISGFKYFSPMWIYVDMPDDPEQRKLLRTVEWVTGPLHMNVAKYEPYFENVEKLSNYGKELTREDIELNNIDAADGAVKSYNYFGRYTDAELLVNTDSGEVLGIKKY